MKGCCQHLDVQMSVRLRWSWFRAAHLVLCPRFGTKTAQTERTPPVLQLLLNSPSQSPGFLLLVSSLQEQGGWPGGGDTAGTAHPQWPKTFQNVLHHAEQSRQGCRVGRSSFSKSSGAQKLGMHCPADAKRWLFYLFLYFLYSHQLLHCLYISTIKSFLLLYFWLATWSCWEGMSGDWPVSWGLSSPLSHGFLNASQILSPHEV